MNTVDDEKQSQKIKFPIELNKKNILLDFLRKYGDSPRTNGSIKYITLVLENTIQKLYGILNTYFNFLNKNIPETLIVFFGPLITMMSSWIFMLYGLFCFIWYYFTEFLWIFKRNTNLKDDGKQEWEEATIFDPLSLAISWFTVFIFLITLFFGFALFPFIVSLLYFYCRLTPLFMTGLKDDAKFSCLSMFFDFIKYKKHFIMYVITFMSLISITSYFGTYIGAISLLATLLIYFNLIPVDLFTKNIPDKLSKLASYEQAKKTCTKSAFSQNGGASIEEILHKIKKLNKIIKSN